MAKKTDRDELLKWIEKQPELLGKLAHLRAIEEDDKRVDIDRIELEMVELVQGIGNGSLQRCIQGKENGALDQERSKGGGRLGGKKKLNITGLFGPMSIEERVLRRHSKAVRPLALLLRVVPGGYTHNLQRVVVDFGAEDSFEQASKRLLQHHRVRLSESSIRKITLFHAQEIAKRQKPKGSIGILPRRGADQIITQIDGLMLPIVDPQPGRNGDNRRKRQCHWREVRLSAARVKDSVETKYGVSGQGVQEAGMVWGATVAKSGWGMESGIHVVGDGATWIAQQSQVNFGGQASFLLDYYHVCEYLADAMPAAGTHKSWFAVQKKRLKENRAEKVLDALSPYIEEASVDDDKAPVRAAYRYLSNRIDQLDYAGAIKAGLPIGSGMIEGGHRHVLQKRLKISGAWWRKENLMAMANLRVCRINEEEDHYWDNQKVAA